MKRISVFLFFLFSISFLTSQSRVSSVIWADYVNQVWTAAEGLPGNTVTDLLQKSDGYLYIGTYDGLVRFDGVKFTILNKNTVSDFRCVSARTIFEDTDGNLWVGSNDEGIAKISSSGIEMFTTDNGLPNNSIRDIAQDKSGNIWIGTSNGVVFLTPSGKFVSPEGLDAYDDSSCLVISLYCDTAGRIWLSTTKKHGLYYYSSGKFTQYTAFNAIDYSTVTAITQDDTGSFWYGLTQKGVVRVSEGNYKLYGSQEGMLETTVNDIYLDNSNSLWFGTEKGVVLYKQGQFSTYTEAEGLTNNNVKKIIEDREGSIWYATDRGGVQKMSPGKFRTVTLSSPVNCISESDEGLVWIGTDNGLLCYEKGVFIENELTKMLKGIRIRHIENTNKGDLLVSTYAKYGQVLMTKEGQITYWTTKHGLVGDRVRVAIEDKSQNLWIGTTTGLTKIDYVGAELTSYTKNEGLENEYVMCLYEDTEGYLWIGTDGGGICIMKDGKIVSVLTTKDGLAGNVIFKIMQDKNGVYWISTGTGLTRIEGNKFKNFTASDGLGTDSIFQIMIDYTDTVWMTSNRGISSIALSVLEAASQKEGVFLDPKFYTKNDGLRSGGVTSTSLCMYDSLGRLWFTLIDGFAIYDPVKIKSNPVPPLVEIEDISIDNVKEKFSANTVLKIPAGTKRVDIEYTALSFVSTDMIRFRYILEGFENDYSQLTSSRSVSYTNLAPGNYTFKVWAANSDMLWCENPASITIIQKPFLYQMPVFWIFIGLVICGIIYSIIVIRINRLKREQLRLETMVQMKTIDLEIERDNSDRLLLNILPKPIAEILKERKNQIIADKFENVSVLFADIVGFTKITSSASPETIIFALNDLFSRFDERAQTLGIEKIKTIGDAYMAVCGLPEPNPMHAAAMIQFARGMLLDIEQYNLTSSLKFKMRIGINSGDVIAGVIGKTKFIYDLWGDTVNVASRMESSGEPGSIHVSEETWNLAKDSVCFTDEVTVDVKGKGSMKTYYVSISEMSNT
ncbi:MAG TPA: adenylate/guanylate cyclase domain-containing protein [Treponemataceae bacterium]|nr:adenylate/guanylate cyclase domain-containing protein [Treponemataceae bacterium]